MIKLLLLLVLINIDFGTTLVHQRPLAKKLWTQHCDKNTFVLNNCNWCWCDGNRRYTCHARHCAQVDMAGHFNDAIEALDVGMEGHGVWRTNIKTPCRPGITYNKGYLLCLCSEEGNWPNKVCRDSFQFLHPIQPTKYSRPRSNQRCSPSKLHLIGCIVCLCPSSGRIDPKLCTDESCTDEIPKIHKNTNNESSIDEINEIHATCDPEETYEVDQKMCTCLPGNRLQCNDNTEEIKSPSRRSSCDGRNPWVTFEVDCNTCVCDDEDSIFCTNNDCSVSHIRQGLPSSLKKSKLTCTPGSKWKKDCNFCHCLPTGIPKCTQNRCDVNKKSNTGLFACVPNTSWKDECNNCRCLMNGSPICTMKSCNVNEFGDPFYDGDLRLDCAPGTMWTIDCNRCQCNQDGRTTTCTAKRCISPKGKDGGKIYPYPNHKCKPGKVWKKGCNTCRCSDDGANVSCTAKQCLLKNTFSKLVGPVKVNRESLRDVKCRKGQLFEIDCNFCYCMDYGDLICTTRSCDEERNLLE